MKTLKIFIGLLIFCTSVAHAQIAQKVKTWYDYDYNLFEGGLGIPADTFAIPAKYRNRPHIAMRPEGLYLWSVTQQKWVPGNDGGGSGIDLNAIHWSDTLGANPRIATRYWVNQQGFLKSYIETDPNVPAHVKGITSTNISNWNSAFGWGNHAGLYPTIQRHLDSLTAVQLRLNAKLNISDTTNRWQPRGNYLTGEADPTVPGYVKGITTGNISNWNTAFDKYPIGFTISGGATKTLSMQLNDGTTISNNFTDLTGTGGGGITEEVDPTIPAAVKAITSTNIGNWNTAYSWGNHAGLYPSTQRFLDSLAAVAGRYVPKSRIIKINGVAQSLDADREWNITTGSNYSSSGAIRQDGNVFSLQGQPTGTTGTKVYSWVDGVYSFRDAINYKTRLPLIAGQNLAWDADSAAYVNTTPKYPAYMTVTGGTTKTINLGLTDGTTVSGTFTDLSGTGDGGITEETDPTIPAHVKGITTANISNWNAAFGWGNHAGLYPAMSRFLDSLVAVQARLNTKLNIADTANKWQPKGDYLTGYTETDPTVPSIVKGITSGNISNWNAAYSWGNHSGLYPLNQRFLDSMAAVQARINGKLNIGDTLNKWQPKGDYLLSETDPTIPGHIKGITMGNIANWNTAYNRYPSTMTVTGGASKNINLTLNDGTVITAPFTDLSGTGGGGITEEVDPTVPAAVKAITSGNIANWNAAYGWGNHAGLYPSVSRFLDSLSNAQARINTKLNAADTLNKWQPKGTYITSESDPTIAAHIKAITSGNISNWNAAFGWGNHATQGYLKSVDVAGKLSISDTAAMLNGYLRETDTTNKWQPKGNYLTGYTETDPTVPAHVKGISQADINNWNNDQVGITSESDPTVPSVVKAITSANIANWNSAFGWGNHAGLYPNNTRFLDSLAAVQVRLNNKLNSADTANKWQPKGTYLTAETDPSVPAAVKAITSTNITNWNTAFGWGNHAGLYPVTQRFLDSMSAVQGRINEKASVSRLLDSLSAIRAALNGVYTKAQADALFYNDITTPTDSSARWGRPNGTGDVLKFTGKGGSSGTGGAGGVGSQVLTDSLSALRAWINTTFYHDIATPTDTSLQLRRPWGPNDEVKYRGTGGSSGSGSISLPINISDVSGLQSALNGKASASHTHAISDVTSLQSALDGKESASNKSTSTSLGTSNTLYPTQNAVKTYVDNAIAGVGGTADGNSYHTGITAVNGVIQLTSSNTAPQLNATASGLWNISISGNAATVTNGVYTNNIKTINGQSIVGTGDITIAGSGESNAGVNLGAGAGVYAGKSGVNLQFRSLVGTAQKGVKVTNTGNEIAVENNAYEYYDKGTGSTSNGVSVTLATIPFIPFSAAGSIEVDIAGMGDDGNVIIGKRFIPFRRVSGGNVELFTPTNLSADFGGLALSGAFWQATTSGAQIYISATGVIGVNITWKVAYKVSYTSLILD